MADQPFVGQDASTLKLDVLSQKRVDALAERVVWDLYNVLVGEIPGLDTDEAFDQFNETLGAELIDVLFTGLAVQGQENEPGESVA